MNCKPTFFIATALFVMSLCPVVNGQLTISSTSTVGIGASEAVILSAVGTDPVSNLTLITASDGPVVSSITGLGLLAGNTPSHPAGAAPGGTAVSSTFLGPFNPQSIDGQDFVSVGFDTTALNVGDTFNLALSFSGVDTFFNDNSTDIDVNASDVFQITVVGEAIPEPSSAAFLLATGSLALLRRRKRC